jgi:hypothetical protein
MAPPAPGTLLVAIAVTLRKKALSLEYRAGQTALGCAHAFCADNGMLTMAGLPPAALRRYKERLAEMIVAKLKEEGLPPPPAEGAEEGAAASAADAPAAAAAHESTGWTPQNAGAAAAPAAAAAPKSPARRERAQEALSASSSSGGGLLRSPSVAERLARLMEEEGAAERSEAEAKQALAAAYAETEEGARGGGGGGGGSGASRSPAPDAAVAAASAVAWEAHVDEEGATFYYETVSGHSQWERPEGGVAVKGELVDSGGGGGPERFAAVGDVAPSPSPAEAHGGRRGASPSRSSPGDFYSSDDDDDGDGDGLTAAGEEVWQI